MLELADMIDNEATIVNGIPYVPKVKWRLGDIYFKKS